MLECNLTLTLFYKIGNFVNNCDKIGNFVIVNVLNGNCAVTVAVVFHRIRTFGLNPVYYQIATI